MSLQDLRLFEMVPWGCDIGVARKGLKGIRREMVRYVCGVFRNWSVLFD